MTTCVIRIEHQQLAQMHHRPIRLPGLAQSDSEVEKNVVIIRALASQQLQELNCLRQLSPAQLFQCGLNRIWIVRVGIPGDLDQLVTDEDSGSAAESLELPREVSVNSLAKFVRSDSASFGWKQGYVEVLR